MRLFGTRDNNLWQYNLAWFRRLDKDINSGLNDVGEDLRDDDVFVANLYRQDFPILGLTSQATVVHNRNRDDAQIDDNGFPARPAEIGVAELREYDVTYFGLNFDGHIGRLNLTASGYYAIGEDENSLLTGEQRRHQRVLPRRRAVDRLRLDPPQAVGALRERRRRSASTTTRRASMRSSRTRCSPAPTPATGSGRASRSSAAASWRSAGRNAVLPSLRSSKEQGQSNFVNPGLTLLGVGADFDILPELRLSFNANYLRFNKTAVLEELRQQPDISNEIGWDLSAAAIWRPFLNQNVVLRLSGAGLIPGDGFEELFGSEDDDDIFYSVLANIVLVY